LNAAGVRIRIVDGASTIGGGSAPGSTLPTRLIEIEPQFESAQEIERHLRESEVPIIARIENDRVVLDLRTVDPADDSVVLAACTTLKGKRKKGEGKREG
jgi:L-seryl-tRNA(Ser) seleniumtransferase